MIVAVTAVVVMIVVVVIVVVVIVIVGLKRMRIDRGHGKLPPAVVRLAETNDWNSMAGCQTGMGAAKIAEVRAACAILHISSIGPAEPASYTGFVLIKEVAMHSFEAAVSKSSPTFRRRLGSLMLGALVAGAALAAPAFAQANPQAQQARPHVNNPLDVNAKRIKPAPGVGAAQFSPPAPVRVQAPGRHEAPRRSHDRGRYQAPSRHHASAGHDGAARHREPSRYHAPSRYQAPVHVGRPHRAA